METEICYFLYSRLTAVLPFFFEDYFNYFPFFSFVVILTAKENKLVTFKVENLLLNK